MNTLNAGAVSFYNWAVGQGQKPQPDTGTPQAGDSILFFNPHYFPSFADHVGVVTSVSSTGVIDMVNGDFSGGRVHTVLLRRRAAEHAARRRHVRELGRRHRRGHAGPRHR